MGREAFFLLYQKAVLYCLLSVQVLHRIPSEASTPFCGLGKRPRARISGSTPVGCSSGLGVSARDKHGRVHFAVALVKQPENPRECTLQSGCPRLTMNFSQQ